MGKSEINRTKKLSLTFTVVVLIMALVAGFLLTNSPGLEQKQGSDQEKTGLNLYTYSLGIPDDAGAKVFIVTIETNWTSKPEVYLPEPEVRQYDKSIVLIFLNGTSNKNAYFNVTIPTKLLSGNISLIWKYYEQTPDRYALSNNGTHNAVQMTFAYKPFFSGMGYFRIQGTEASW